MSNISDTNVLNNSHNNLEKDTVTINIYTSTISCPHCQQNINLNNQSKPPGRPRKNLTDEEIKERIEKQRKTALDYYYKRKNNLEHSKKTRESQESH